MSHAVKSVTHSSEHVSQVAGLFTVGATALACLYFLDPTNVASDAGLEAVGVLLLLLNIVYVIAMALLVAVTGAHKTKRFTNTAVTTVATAASNLGGVGSASLGRLRSMQVPFRSISLRRSQTPDKGPIVPTSPSTDGSTASSIWHHQRSRTGEFNRGSSMQLSLLHPATDTGVAIPPDRLRAQDVEASDVSEDHRSTYSHMPVLSIRTPARKL